MRVMKVLLLVDDDVWRMMMILFENIDHFVDQKVKIYLEVLVEINQDHQADSSS
jgi:hypothetical protein